MLKQLLVIIVILVSTKAFAGEAENISACVKKAKEFSGVSLDPFAVKYVGNIISMSTARWGNSYCEVKLGEVFTLIVDENTLIYRGYAGKESYDLNEALQSKTQDAIRQMRSRIALLEQRASQVSVSLQRPKPNHKWLTQYVDEGIQKSLGSGGQNTQEASIPNASKNGQKHSSETAPAPVRNPTDTTSLSNSPPISESTKDYQETLIPRSISGDKGMYYLLEARQGDGVIKTLHKRVGIDATGYTRSEINCGTMQYREIGYSETSPTAISEKAGNWTELVDGSSKSDLVKFVCRR